MYTVEAVRKAFRRYPYNASNHIAWFDKITDYMVGELTPRSTHPRVQCQGPLVAWKQDGGAKAVTYDDAFVFTFGNLYPSIICTFTDEFTIPNYLNFHQTLLLARQQAKLEGDVQSAGDIKRYINTIFGQLWKGKIHHETRTPKDVLEDARKIMTSIFSLDTCVYVDTDMAIFTHFCNDETAAIHNACMSTTGWSLGGDLTQYKSIVIEGKKRVRYIK